MFSRQMSRSLSTNIKIKRKKVIGLNRNGFKRNFRDESLKETDPNKYYGFVPPPESKMHNYLGQLMGTYMWLFIFWRFKEEGVYTFGIKHHFEDDDDDDHHH